MPRPIIKRKVCCMPKARQFWPIDIHVDKNLKQIMTVDEYETIRLIDLEGLMQQECANQMCIARTTVQRIYNDARKKIANALVNGIPLFIKGGKYSLCDRKKKSCHCIRYKKYSLSTEQDLY